MTVRLHGLVAAGFLAPLAGCATDGGTGRRYLAKYGAAAPDPAAFAVCWGYGCRREAAVDLGSEWDAIAESFAEPAANAEAERRAIAAAVGAWERAVAAMTPIGHYRGGTFEGVGEVGQLDCVDEFINTTRVLVLLEAQGLLRFHRVKGADSRGAFVFGWPHTSAVIADKATGQRYAVDSWFHDNGAPAEIVPIEAWKSGWSPGDAT
ncbi:MAG: hypothetical protein FJX36_11580 [Alphaproteobacteria bacterium]|nr:hypothetical protein [Alphaproteobacteria bacterium]